MRRSGLAWALGLLLLGCHAPGATKTAAKSAPGIHEDAAAPERPAPPSDEPAATAESAPELLLHIDAKREYESGTRGSALAASGLEVIDCDEVDPARPLPCGFALQCRDLAKRWSAQLGFADEPELARELAARSYPEAACPGPQPSGADDFAKRAMVIHHALDVLPADAVEGVLVETRPGRYRGLARIGELIYGGMATQIDYRPVASWNLDVDGLPGEELVLLILGDDNGHARDPAVDALVVFCGTAPEPWCGRVSLGHWTPARFRGRGQPKDTLVELEVYAGGRLRLGERALGLDELERADLRLDRRWGA